MVTTKAGPKVQIGEMRPGHVGSSYAIQGQAPEEIGFIGVRPDRSEQSDCLRFFPQRLSPVSTSAQSWDVRNEAKNKI